MSTTQHTPGRFRVHTEGDKTGIVTDSGVEHIATVHGFRKEANARLMAAAPELLARVKQLEKTLDNVSLFLTGPARDGDLIALESVISEVETNRAEGLHQKKAGNE